MTQLSQRHLLQQCNAAAMHQHSHALQDVAFRHQYGHQHGIALAQQSMQQYLQQGVAPATPETEDEQLDFLRRVLSDIQRQVGEIDATNAELRKRITALETGLASLRVRTAERDASLAWAIRRGKS